ncbi:uncharacterized protein [Physcomitrium patens]|uniref:uncharacterized protein n=1 Tax=Physcomitrium patens TaxID=3218 RepID=UPI003CCCB4BB
MLFKIILLMLARLSSVTLGLFSLCRYLLKLGRVAHISSCSVSIAFPIFRLLSNQTCSNCTGFSNRLLQSVIPQSNEHHTSSPQNPRYSLLASICSNLCLYTRRAACKQLESKEPLMVMA